MTYRGGKGGLWALAGLVGLVVFIKAYPHFFPEAALRAGIGRKEAIVRGTTFLARQGIRPATNRPDAELRYQQDQLRHLVRTYGAPEAIRLMTDSIPVFFWEVTWKGAPQEGENRITVGSEASQARRPGSILLRLDLKGRPFGFEVDGTAPEEVSGTGKKDPFNRAESLSRDLLLDFETGWILTQPTDSLHPEGVQVFRWERRRPIAGERVAFTVEVTEGGIRRFHMTREVPPLPSSEEKSRRTVSAVAFMVIYLLTAILGITCFITRLKSDTIDLTWGVVPAFSALIAWILIYWSEAERALGWETIIGFFITAPFVAGGIWLITTVGESLTREVWPKKLTVMDGLRNSHRFPSFGRSLLVGLSFGAVLLGLYTVLTGLLPQISSASLSLGEARLARWSVAWPLLYASGRSFLGPLYLAATYVFFFPAWLAKRVRNSFYSVLILALFWGFLSLPLPSLMPAGPAFAHQALLGLLIMAFYRHHEPIAATVALVTWPMLYEGLSAWLLGGAFTATVPVLLIPAALLVYGLFSLRGREPDSSGYVPDYLQRIYERQRIQRELEIARTIQLRFLPKETPQIPGLEIASFCLPAMEVGGDYYDFVDLGPKTVGVTVGDVSGKGIPAAFYMTLTKGLFQAQARSIRSPREVLLHLNTLFCTYAERGIFISMVYAVFDLEARRLTLARAGHNPVLILRSGEHFPNELCPPGLALGFDPGTRFEKTIREEALDLKPGDLFFFYTDGLTEAHNRFHREFGESRLKRLLSEEAHRPVEGLLTRIREEIALFSGETAPQDDMTAVALKVVDSSP